MTCSAVGCPQTETVSIAVHTTLELHAGFSNAQLGREKTPIGSARFECPHTS